MTRFTNQAPSAVILIRPHHFVPNAQTAADNAFQQSVEGRDVAALKAQALAEVNGVIAQLTAHGVKLHVFDDTRADTPDSVFPNNWFSTHPDGQVAIYPMYAENRRQERRADVIDLLKKNYVVKRVRDYSPLEGKGLFLEGTGAMVLDHDAQVAYAVRSNRSNPEVLNRFCRDFDYDPVIFEAADQTGTPVYHTNVLMCIAQKYALIGLDMIASATSRADITRRLEQAGREIIKLTPAQIGHFVGNALEVRGDHGPLLAISARALSALTDQQIALIEKSAKILPLEVPTIELAGGSVRCMLAGVHLTARA